MPDPIGHPSPLRYSLPGSLPHCSPPNPSSSTKLENPLTVPCVNVFLCVCVYVLMCSTKLSTALSPSKFYRFFGRKRSGITPFFKTSKQLFQRRFHLSVSPDCKMCVRVTNTGKVNRYVLCFGTICHYLCPIYKTFQYLIKFVYLQVGNP